MNCCDYDCRQGRNCPARKKLTEAALDRHNADMRMPAEPLPDAALAQMLADGSIEGPYRPVRPMKTGWRLRLDRWVRRHLIDWETPSPSI